MDLIDYTKTWAKGEVIQGRIMVLAGIVLLIVAVAMKVDTEDAFEH